MGFADTRKARDAAKRQKAAGVDLVQSRKLDELKGQRDGGDTFQAMTLEWHERQTERCYGVAVCAAEEADPVPWKEFPCHRESTALR